jgi:hypothetical protein
MQKLLTRKQIRLKNYDYSSNEYYHITLCSQNRQNIFGEIINNENTVGAGGYRPNTIIKLNEYGLIIDKKLKNTDYIV